MKLHKRQRRGVTAVLAMLYLVLFSAMALGFYAATTTSSQMASTDEQVTKSHLAAESGMDFMRYQLAQVYIPPSTPANQVLSALYTNLQSQLIGSGNMAGQTIRKSGNTIEIPSSATGAIRLDSNNQSRFRVTITDWVGEIVVKVDGMHGSASIRRAFTMDFSRQERTTNAFNFAVASKGQIVAAKGAITSAIGVDPKIASLMSAQAVSNAISVTGGVAIGGDLSIIEGATANVTGGSVGGSNIPSVIQAEHVHLVEPPEFPTIDTSAYRPYAVNNYNGALKVQANIYVPPNTNPIFNGNTTVQGVMFVDTPNKVTINGSFNLQGFIVMASGTSTSDEIILSGNVTSSAPPNQPQFDSLRSVSGVAIMAPTARVSMTGSSASLRGSVMSDTFSFTGAGDMNIDQGTIMTFNPSSNSAVFNSSKSVRFSATGANNQPKVGVSYSTFYLPNPSSYQEVTP